MATTCHKYHSYVEDILQGGALANVLRDDAALLDLLADVTGVRVMPPTLSQSPAQCSAFVSSWTPPAPCLLPGTSLRMQMRRQLPLSPQPVMLRPRSGRSVGPALRRIRRLHDLVNFRIRATAGWPRLMVKFRCAGARYRGGPGHPGGMATHHAGFVLYLYLRQVR